MSAYPIEFEIAGPAAMFTKNVQDAPPLAVGRNERSWGWARCPRQDAVESVLGFQVLKAPPLAAG